MLKKLVVSLVSTIIVGCATQPPPRPAPKCVTVAGKCKTFTADDQQGATTYGHSNESQ